MRARLTLWAASAFDSILVRYDDSAVMDIVIRSGQLTVPRIHMHAFGLLRTSPFRSCKSRLLTSRNCRFLAHTFHTRILNPAFIPVALRTLRATLFPNNALGPPRQIPTDEEIEAIKHCCAATLLDLVPPKVAAAFFASDGRDTQVRQIEDILGCLDDAYLNKHLVFQIVELIGLRLFPELGEQGVKDLLDERIS